MVGERLQRESVYSESTQFFSLIDQPGFHPNVSDGDRYCYTHIMGWLIEIGSIVGTHFLKSAAITPAEEECNGRHHESAPVKPQTAR